MCHRQVDGKEEGGAGVITCGSFLDPPTSFSLASYDMYAVLLDVLYVGMSEKQ